MVPSPQSMPDDRLPARSATAIAGSTPRLMSLDALRGFDMFWIIGAEDLVHALHKISDTGIARGLADQLTHEDWEGFRFYDLIFPLFVFIVGVSLVFSLSRTIETAGRASAVKRVIRRGVLLFILGIFYSGGFSTSGPDIRLLGVLNRIALCYLFAGLIFCFFRLKGMIAICTSLLIGYWALLTFTPFPDVRPTPGGSQAIAKETGYTNVAQLDFASTNIVRGVFIKGVNYANYLDQKYLPAKKWDGTWDPEGLLSTLPAIATCLLGVFAGLLLKSKAVADQRKVLCLLLGGLACVLLGHLWGLQFPVIKKIWTSSYVLVAGGYSALLLGLFYLVVDVWKYQKWCQPFVWIGMNSITVYLANNIISFDRLALRFAGGDVRKFFDTTVVTGFGDLVVALVGLGLGLLLCHFLYRKKIFLRL
jgi:predicted acyltransferase